MSLTDSAFIPSDRAVPMVGGDPMDNLRPVEKNIVLFWLMMWYISIYSRLLRRCLPVSWMFGKTRSGWLLKAVVLRSACRVNQAARTGRTGN
jgi:hypothetical protein